MRPRVVGLCCLGAHGRGSSSEVVGVLVKQAIPVHMHGAMQTRSGGAALREKRPRGWDVLCMKNLRGRETNQALCGLDLCMCVSCVGLVRCGLASRLAWSVLGLDACWADLLVGLKWALN